MVRTCINLVTAWTNTSIVQDPCLPQVPLHGYSLPRARGKAAALPPVITEWCLSAPQSWDKVATKLPFERKWEFACFDSDGIPPPPTHKN